MKKVIKKHLKAEVMNTPEYRDIELQIREEKLLRMKWDEKRIRSKPCRRGLRTAIFGIRFLSL